MTGCLFNNMIIIPVWIQNTLENDPKLFIIVTEGKTFSQVCVHNVNYKMERFFYRVFMPGLGRSGTSGKKL